MKTLKMMAVLALATTVSVWAGETVDRTINVDADVEVDLENIAGSVEVEGWDRNEVRIVAELGDDTEGMDIEADSGEVRIEVDDGMEVDKDGWAGRPLGPLVKAAVLKKLRKGLELTLPRSEEFPVGEQPFAVEIASISGVGDEVHVVGSVVAR